MLSNLKKTLAKTSKYKLWQEAYVFTICQDSVQNWLKQKSSSEVGGVQVFLKMSSKTLNLKITATEPTLMSWLKVNQQDLFEQITQDLQTKDALGTRELELHFK